MQINIHESLFNFWKNWNFLASTLTFHSGTFQMHNRLLCRGIRGIYFNVFLIKGWVAGIYFQIKLFRFYFKHLGQGSGSTNTSYKVSIGVPTWLHSGSMLHLVLLWNLKIGGCVHLPRHSISHITSKHMFTTQTSDIIISEYLQTSEIFLLDWLVYLHLVCVVFTLIVNWCDVFLGWISSCF